MVKIIVTSVEDILGPFDKGHIDVSVSLFVVSPKNQRLKMLNVDGLSLEERSLKLKKWGEQNRFVAVLQMGDEVCAYTFQENVQGLQKQSNLSLNGKKMTVKGLTKAQSARLSKIAQSFEKYLLPKDQKKKELDAEVLRLSGTGVEKIAPKNQQLYMTKGSLSLFELLIKNHLGKIITNCMRQYNEAKREEKRIVEEDLKSSEIKGQVKRKEILRFETKTTERKRTEQL